MEDVAIKCTHVSKTYKQLARRGARSVQALRDVSLTVGAGQVVGLIGPNGAGKTTLMNLIAGLLHPTGGEVAVGGHASGSIDAKRLLGYMPESPAFLEGYTVENELRYHGALCRLARHERVDRARRLLERVGLQDFATRPCATLSHGMRQRLALAIALVMQPHVLLLDEPSNGLDPLGVVQLRELVTALSGEGAAILISSHRLHELEKLTSTFVGIWDGRVVDMKEQVTAKDGQVVRIEIRHDLERAQQLLSRCDIVRACGTELVLRIHSQNEIAPIVSQLVSNRIHVKSLRCDEESIEDVFLRISRDKAAREETARDR